MAKTLESGISRRSLLTAIGAVGFEFAFRMPVQGANEPIEPPDDTTGKFAPNAFIRIDRAGLVTLVMPQVEMGQGVYTSIGMILAEELDADFAKVVLEHAPPSDKLYGNPVFGIQVTGNSNSIRAFWTPLRTAGATARAMLVNAAASSWQVDPSTCRTADGVVSHPGSGRTVGYGDLVDLVARETAPKDVKLKNPTDFKLIGKSLKRKDTPDKVNGKVVYGIDAMLPDMKFATIAACPVLGGKVASVEEGGARSIPGVRQIIVLDDLVAVVGDHMWAAKRGLSALTITWDEGPNASVDSAAIWAGLRKASEQPGVVAKTVGDVDRALSTGDKLEAAYEVPFLAHATMEPMNCTVNLKKDTCEIFLGSQVLARVQSEVAKLLGFPLESVIVHNHLIGGGFGRRLEPDMALSAVRVAQKVDGPLKVVWTREEDIRHDVYRPVYRDTVSASITNGKIAGWKYKVTGSAVLARWLPPAFQKGIDIDAIDSAVDIPYEIPNLEVAYSRYEPPAVTTGFWRGVGPNNNVFATECFMDELARKAGKDPIAFRKDMLTGNPRLRAVLDLVAEKSNWATPLPPRRGRGVSAQPSFASFIATVAEVEVDDHGEVRVHRVTCVVDTGIAVNPDTIAAQLQGGIIFGLTAALYGDITIEKGRVQQSNFHNYRIMRIDQAPDIEVHVVKSGEPPGGIGETGVATSSPALRNAIYAATGVALRRLPVDRSLIARKA